MRSGFLAALVAGAVSWLGGQWYLLKIYPGHRELLPFAATLGLIDGLLIGGLAAIISFAVRLWRRERLQRLRSDELLRQELDSASGQTPRSD